MATLKVVGHCTHRLRRWGFHDNYRLQRTGLWRARRANPNKHTSILAYARLFRQVNITYESPVCKGGGVGLYIYIFIFLAGMKGSQGGKRRTINVPLVVRVSREGTIIVAGKCR